MSEKKFIDGLIVKPPRDGAPDYVICKLSIKRQALIAWLQQQEGEWINADVKESQGGKLYAAVDDWKPNGQRGGGQQQRSAGRQQSQPPMIREQSPPADDFADDDIPF
ncbi:hypothetical protein [Stenotrophomonas sp.]|uniref:hypothetical protein n=1 Tax=Stenotrophomonas sp. TaxID=69392 RepID=UPI0028A8EA65|nr:hypothetical protein [Stenotrophomonas sp.]